MSAFDGTIYLLTVVYTKVSLCLENVWLLYFVTSYFLEKYLLKRIHDIFGIVAFEIRLNILSN